MSAPTLNPPAPAAGTTMASSSSSPSIGDASRYTTTTPASSNTMMGQVQRSGNMYAQLEAMMTAVKKEAGALEAMKQKFKEMEELKAKMPELKKKLQQADDMNTELQKSLKESEMQSSQLRNDMQKLNDLYTSERIKYNDISTSNSRLDQELLRSQQDMAMLKRENDNMVHLRNKNQSLSLKLKQLQHTLDEEKVQHQNSISQLEKRIEEYDKDKAIQGSMFWKLTEELKVTKDKLKTSEESIESLAESLSKLSSLQSQGNDRHLMSAEDEYALINRIEEIKTKATRDLAVLQQESDLLKHQILKKDDVYNTLAFKYRKLEDDRLFEKAEVKAKMSEYMETVSALRSKNHELEKEAMEASHQLGLVGGDITRYSSELEQAQMLLAKAESAKHILENDMNTQLKLSQQRESQLQQQRDEAVHKMSSMNTQFEVMQSQIRENNNRNWEELQRTKELEAQVAEETELLTTELQEKSLKLIAIEAEMVKVQDMVSTEVSHANSMSTALRVELEKRLDELSVSKKENDRLRKDNDDISSRYDDLEASMKRNESSYKKALDTDRSKIQIEIKAKVSRLKALEAEKQELLNETSGLMATVSENQKELSKMRKECEDAKVSTLEVMKELETVKVHNQELLVELKISSKKEQDSREYSNKMEAQFREDMSRLDQMIKDSKKGAAQQVLELSMRVKASQEELEDVKLQKAEVLLSEKKAYAEVEKIKIESSLIRQQSEELQQQMSKEITAARKEVHEYRSKAKLIAENKTQMEMELMSARVELTKNENAMQRMGEWVKETEANMHANSERMRLATIAVDTANSEVLTMKGKAVQLEEAIAKKTISLDKSNKEIARMEREGLAETRRLKGTLGNLEQELLELRPMIPMLQKELADGKSNFQRLQQSTNSTVNGLLEELKNTENALSTERKHAQVEADKYHSRVQELQSKMDRLKDSIEVTESKSKTTRNDTAAKLIQTQNELERVKAAVVQKEKRLEELEKQHQTDRMRLHEMKEHIDSAERSSIDSRTNLELEQAQRRRVEARLKAVTAELAKTVDSDTSIPTATATLANSQHHQMRISTNDDDVDSFLASPVSKKTSRLQSASPHRSHILHENMHAKDERHVVYDESALIADDSLLSPHLVLEKVSTHNKNKLQQLQRQADMAKKAGTAAYDDDDVLFMSPKQPGGGNDRYGDAASDVSYSVEVSTSAIGQATQSPAIDRVSVALAARAAAESSKNTLKLAQQQRNLDKQQQVLATSDSSSSSNTSSSTADGIRQYQVFRRSSKGKVSDVREIVDSAAATEGGESVEDSIQRTQTFLHQRLANKTIAENNGNGNSYSDAAHQAQVIANAAYYKQQDSSIKQTQPYNSMSNGGSNFNSRSYHTDQNTTSMHSSNDSILTVSTPAFAAPAPASKTDSHATLQLPKIDKKAISAKRTM